MLDHATQVVISCECLVWPNDIEGVNVSVSDNSVTIRDPGVAIIVSQKGHGIWHDMVFLNVGGIIKDHVSRR